MGDKSRQMLLQNGNMLQDQNNQITQIIQTLEQTSETAQMTAVKLKEQDQKIMGIANTNKEIQKENRRAERTMDSISRREYYTNLILYLVAFLLFASIIIVIVVKLSK